MQVLELTFDMTVTNYIYDS